MYLSAVSFNLLSEFSIVALWISGCPEWTDGRRVKVLLHKYTPVTSTPSCEAFSCCQSNSTFPALMFHIKKPRSGSEDKRLQEVLNFIDGYLATL